MLRVCESVAFDEVHDEIGYGFQRHEKQHCQAHGQGAIAPVKQPPPAMIVRCIGMMRA